MILVTLSGQDRPGITAGVMRVLSQHQAHIADIGQAVLHGHLSLSVLFSPPGQSQPQDILKDLLFSANEMGLQLQYRIDPPASEVHAETHRYAVTLMGSRVPAAAFADVTGFLAEKHLNIITARKLSGENFGCFEIEVGSSQPFDPAVLRTQLLEMAQKHGVDIALQSNGLLRRAKRLVVFDVDSTLIENEVIDEFAREVGRYEEVARITLEAMSGQLSFEASLNRRVSTLDGLTQSQIDAVYSRIQLTPGAEELIHVLKRLGYKIGIISGGFTCITDRLQQRLALDYAYANRLEMSDGVATGKVHPPIITAERKAQTLEQIAKLEGIPLEQVIAVGDGANDALMLAKAGLGIAFNAKPVLRAQADLAINHRNLTNILYVLGHSSEEVKDFT